jgi:hypothetical protein
MERKRANTTATLSRSSTNAQNHVSSASFDQNSSNSNTPPSSSTTSPEIVQRNASFSHSPQSYYRHYPDYKHFFVHRRHAPSTRFDLMLLDAFRPLCAPSTIRPTPPLHEVSSSSGDSGDEAKKKKSSKIPTIVLHSGSGTESTETDGDSLRMDDESDE